MMWFIWLPIFLIIIFAVMKMNKNNRGNNAPKDTPLNILKKQYAKGESVKGNAQEGMIGNYFERKVKLIVK